jgi:hypothetical protein
MAVLWGKDGNGIWGAANGILMNLLVAIASLQNKNQLA